MFNYIRLFALTSFAAVLLISGMVGLYFHKEMEQNLVAAGKRESLTIARQFDAALGAPARADKKIDVEAHLRLHIADFIKNMNIKALRVYDTDGILLFTTGGTLSAAQFETEREGLSHRDPPVIGVTVPQKDGTRYLRSFTRAGDAYIEIFTDITPQWNRLLVLQWVASGGVILVFILMLWALLIITRKAEIIIARQHEANMELAAAAASAQAENQAKSQFLANISHELRTPLNAIIGFSEILKTGLPGQTPDARTQDYIGDIHTSGVHLLSLINDILDFSKAEAGKLELEIEEINVTKMVINCLRLVSTRAEESGVQLINAMPRENLIIETDGKKFKQVMLNLLSNAVKFTHQGGQVRVNARHDAAQDAYHFEISDTGIGMAPKDIAKAMTPFEQVDNALSRRYEGTGLGLPLTRKFIELMGGKFEVKSQTGVGTTITFRLPGRFKPREGIVYKKLS